MVFHLNTDQLKQDDNPRVKVANDTSDIFTTKRGVKQGDGLSCDLFNLCLEYVIRKAGIETEGTIFNKSLQSLGFADDIDLVSRHFKNLVEALKKLVTSAEKVGLFLNEDKTKYMYSSRDKHPTGHNVNFGRFNFECVREFVYLGTQVNNNNNTGEEITRRINLANRCLFGLGSILRSKLLSRNTKLLIYKTLVLPVLMYGSEAWTLNNDEQQKLSVFERRVLRMIFGAVCINGIWRSRYYDELYDIYNDVPVVRRIKTQRLRWLGHVQRMNDNDVPKKIFEAKGPQYGQRRRGKPRMRWKDAVEEDLKELKEKTSNPQPW